MPLTQLEHYLVLTHDIDATRDFYVNVLGMENGDRLQSINGFDMTSPEKALEAYARLRTADHMTVAINRKGSNMNLDYNIK